MSRPPGPGPAPRRAARNAGAERENRAARGAGEAPAAREPRRISRRRFVGMLAAGSAAALARTAAAAPAPRRRRPAVKPTPELPATSPPTPEQKEFERQRASTLGVLKTIRDFDLPPGGDLAVVFRPLTGPRRGR